MASPNAWTNSILAETLNSLSKNGTGDGDWNGIKPPAGGWSSLIGIITALVGNVLISFALNTQRYAHMRLGRAREEAEEKHKADRNRRRRKRTSGPDYGTNEWEQMDVAARRERENLKDVNEDIEYTMGDDAGEEDPLIPRLNVDQRPEDEDEENGQPKEKSYLESPIWWLGIALMVVGEAGNFLAYGFAPASIVSPLGVVALVSNCLIAPLLLGEQFRIRDALGVVIAVGGCVTVVLSASSSNPKLTPEKIWSLITQWEFETYLGITAFLIIALVVASNKFGDRSILIDLGLVGLFGGYTALSTKGIASLLSNKVWRVITFPITYLLLAVLVFTAVMQIKYVNRALQRFNATMVIPTQFVMFTISVIVGSAILYRDFEREKTEDAIKFIAGCALTFLGVWCITSGRKDDGNEDEEYGQEEGDISLIDEEEVERDLRQHQRDRQRYNQAQAQMESIPRGTDSLSPSVPLTSGSVTEVSGDGSVLTLHGAEPLRKAAVHSDAAYLPAQTTPAPLHATTSDPTVPTQKDFTSRPKTPLNRNTVSYDRPSPSPLPLPQTPRNNSTPQLVEESPNPTSGQRLLPRTTLFPGPLMSPLSSSLTAVVADSLRRGVDSPSTLSSLRRRSSTLRRHQSRPQSTVIPGPFNSSSSKLNAQGPPRHRHSIASGEMDLDDGTIAKLRDRATARHEGSAVESSNLSAAGLSRDAHSNDAARARSLSATLSDMFGAPLLNRQKTGESDNSRR